MQKTSIESPVLGEITSTRAGPIRIKSLRRKGERASAVYATKTLQFTATLEELALLDAHPRPQRRSECENGPRPCAYVSCVHHLALEVTANGALLITDKSIFNPETGELDLDAMSDTCVLDVADRGESSLEATGEALGGVNKESVRKAEVSAVQKLRRTFERLGIDASYLVEFAQSSGTED